MPGSSDIRHPARLAGLLLAAMAALTACTGSSAVASGTPAAPSPAAAASPSPSAASPTEVSPSPAVGGVNPTPAGGGRYGGGYGSATPTPAPPPAARTLTVKAASTGVGKVLVGANGLTLYTLASDGMNASSCTGGCAANWPPLTVKTGTKIVGGTGVKGTFATITRADGTHQVTYRGKPLYYFAGDSAAGDTNGQGINGVWYAAKP